MAAGPKKIALVGCGAVSRLYYVPAIKALEAAGLVRLDVVVDPDERNASEIVRKFRHITSLRQVSELPGRGVDLAIVASPHSRHAEQTIALLGSNISVLCEKPMATSLRDAQAMLDAAANARAQLAIGMLRRFFPATQTIRQMLTSGAIGELVSFSFEEGDPDFRWPAASPGYFRKSEAHGGVLLDIGVHALDLMSWWFGEPTELTYEDDAMGGIEANCRIRCGFASGLRGELRLSRDCELANRYTIRGSRGWLRWTINEANYFEASFGDTPYSMGAQLFSGAKPAFGFEKSFIDQIRNVVAALQGFEAVRVPASEGIRSIRLIEYCYSNRGLMSMPWLDAQEAERARELHRSVERQSPASV